MAGDVQQYIAIVNDVLQQCEGTTSEACIDEVKIPLLLDTNALRGQRYHLLTPAMQVEEEWIQYTMCSQVKGFWFEFHLPDDFRLLLEDDKEPLDNEEEGREVFNLNELLPSSARLECLRLG